MLRLAIWPCRVAHAAAGGFGASCCFLQSPSRLRFSLPLTLLCCSYGQFKRITGLFTGALTGKGCAAARLGRLHLRMLPAQGQEAAAMRGGLGTHTCPAAAPPNQAGLWRQ